MKNNQLIKSFNFKNVPVGAFVPYFYAVKEGEDLKIRNIELLEDIAGLSKGEYSLIENFCTDIECDCRKVMINVIDEKRETIIGTIGFGWEDKKYYTDWIYGDKKLGKAMTGAYIEIGGVQTGKEGECLVIVKDALKDKEYVEEIKRRYTAFRKFVLYATYENK